MAERQNYPKMPESNWWTLRTQFQKTLPSNVSPSYLMSLLNLTSEKAAKNLLSPLRQLGIIDETGKPTPRANDWRSDSKYPETCKAMVEEVYPQELKDLFPGPEIDKKALKEWFMHNATLGEGAAGQVASMYILLSQPKPQAPEDTTKKPRVSVSKGSSNGNGTKSTTGAKFKDQKNVTDEHPVIETFPQPKQNGGLMPTVHIDLQIHISPEANPEQIEAIFASMAKHLYK